jgi:hypothetical protein
MGEEGRLIVPDLIVEDVAAREQQRLHGLDAFVRIELECFAEWMERDRQAEEDDGDRSAGEAVAGGPCDVHDCGGS